MLLAYRILLGLIGALAAFTAISRSVHEADPSGPWVCFAVAVAALAVIEAVTISADRIIAALLGQGVAR
jgi:hypothetical protein